MANEKNQSSPAAAPLGADFTEADVEKALANPHYTLAAMALEIEAFRDTNQPVPAMLLSVWAGMAKRAHGAGAPLGAGEALRRAATWAIQVLGDLGRLPTMGKPHDGDRWLVHRKGLNRAARAGEDLRAALSSVPVAPPAPEFETWWKERPHFDHLPVNLKDYTRQAWEAARAVPVADKPEAGEAPKAQCQNCERITTRAPGFGFVCDPCWRQANEGHGRGLVAEENGHVPRGFGDMRCCNECGLLVPAKSKCKGKVGLRAPEAPLVAVPVDPTPQGPVCTCAHVGNLGWVTAGCKIHDPERAKLAAQGPSPQAKPALCECPCGCKRPADSLKIKNGPAYRECDWCDSCMHRKDPQFQSAAPSPVSAPAAEGDELPPIGQPQHLCRECRRPTEVERRGDFILYQCHPCKRIWHSDATTPAAEGAGRECWVLWHKTSGPCTAFAINENAPPDLKYGWEWVRMVAASLPGGSDIREAAKPLNPPTDEDLLTFGWAPGDYTGICIQCRQRHAPADKLSIVCRPCAVKRWAKSWERPFPASDSKTAQPKDQDGSGASPTAPRSEDPGPGWRLLREGETILATDEYLQYVGPWWSSMESAFLVGQAWTERDCQPMRRRVEGGSETSESESRSEAEGPTLQESIQQMTPPESGGEMSAWISVSYRLPPEGEIVETKISPPDRNETRLIRHGNLWWFPNMSMYVYYRPTHWRAAPKRDEA